MALFERQCTYTNISSPCATLCCLGKETLQTDAEQINRGSRGKGHRVKEVRLFPDEQFAVTCCDNTGKGQHFNKVCVAVKVDGVDNHSKYATTCN